MLVCLATAMVYPPILIAIVNPADGTAWRQDGSATKCPLSTGLMGKESRYADGSEASTHRLLVFLKDGEKTSRQWDGAPVSPESNRNPLYLVLTDGKDSRFLVFDRKITPEERSIDVSVAYTIESPLTLIDFSFLHGVAILRAGGELHPKAFTSPEAMISLASRRDAKLLRRWWTADVKAVFRYNCPRFYSPQTISHGLSTLSEPWVPDSGIFTFIEEKSPDVMYVAYRKEASSFRRFSVETQGYKTAEFRHVVVRPGEAGGKP